MNNPQLNAEVFEETTTHAKKATTFRKYYWKYGP